MQRSRSFFSSVLLSLSLAGVASALVACKKEPAPSSSAAAVAKDVAQGGPGTSGTSGTSAGGGSPARARRVVR